MMVQRVHAWGEHLIGVQLFESRVGGWALWTRMHVDSMSSGRTG